MYFDDHNPPHFHAKYGGDSAVISINPFMIVSGSLPPRALGLVTEWAAIHQDDLLNDWMRAKEQTTLLKIDPLG